DIEVRHAGPAHLPLVDEPRHLAPRILYRCADLVGPVELIEIDALHTEPTQRRLALAPDRLGSEDASRSRRRVALVPDDAALREDVRPLALRPLAQEATDDLFG